MSPISWTTEKTWNTGDVLPASDLNVYVRDNVAFLHDQGLDLTVVAGAIAPTVQWHKVAGGGVLDTISGAWAAGGELDLSFSADTLVRHQGGGTGNVRLRNGRSYPALAGSTLKLRTDGTNFLEVARSAFGPVGAKLFRAATQAIGNSSELAVSFDSEDLDMTAWPFHDAAPNPTRLTVPADLGGRYRLHGYVPWTDQAKNGYLAFKRTAVSGGAVTYLAIDSFGDDSSATSDGIRAAGHIFWDGDLEAGDFVELHVFQQSGGGKTIAGRSGDEASGVFLAAERIS